MSSDVDFKKCPMYIKSNKMHNDINELHIGHRSIVKELKKIAKANHKKDKFLFKHMENEDIHHINVTESINQTNVAVLSMGETIKTLMKDKTKRDTIKDKREGIKEKVFTALIIATLIGAYNFFTDLMVMKQAIGVE